MSAATDFAHLRRLPPQEAIAYMQGRELVGETFSAYDLWQDQHGRAFTISRLARADLLEAMQRSLAKSVAGDLSRKDWIDNAEQLLKNAGWWGTKEVTDPRTGELLKTRFNHARLQLIFDTNVRQAQAAGQWQRLLRNRRIHPYARYVCMDDDRVRPLHRSWHNVTLPLDDPWWQTHRPPNGYRCRCRIVGISQRDFDRGEVLSRPGAETDENAPIVRQPMRKTAPEDGTVQWTNPATGEVKRIPAGIDPGFDYNAGTVGESAAFKALIERKLAALGPSIAQAARYDGLRMASSIVEIDRFLQGDTPGSIVVAHAPIDILERIGAINAEVLLSRYTANKQTKHPEITAESFEMLQVLLNTGERVYDKALHAVVISLDNPPYVAVLKATTDGTQVYLQSFRRTDAKNIDALRKRQGDS